MTHKAIKRFQIDGSIKDEKDIPRLKDQYVKILVEQMRDSGYVQVLDLTPAFSTQYDSVKQKFDFLLTMHGVYYGNKAKTLYGVSDAREVPL